MAIILSFPDNISMSFLMTCCTTVTAFNTSLLHELGACTHKLFSEYSVVANFSLLSAMPVVAGVACLDTVQLQRADLVRLHKDALP
jgi:hypothetical protein